MCSVNYRDWFTDKKHPELRGMDRKYFNTIRKIKKLFFWDDNFFSPFEKGEMEETLIFVT